MPRFTIETIEVSIVRKTVRHEIVADSFDALEDYDRTGKLWARFPDAQVSVLETDERYEDSDLVGIYKLEDEKPLNILGPLRRQWNARLYEADESAGLL